MGQISWKIKAECFRNDFFGSLKGFPYNPVTSGSLIEVILVVIVDGQVRVEIDFDVSNWVIVDIILIYFLANDEKPNVVFFFDHYLHLVHYELKFFSTVHGSVCLNLHLLKNFGSFQNVVVALFALDDH